MKTQIITLESHDDLISVRDKLAWAKTPRILLVWPKYEKVTLRLLDLKVLYRHADSLGSQLGLVTRRANVRRDAQSLGIPVFESTAAAQRDPWPDSPSRGRRVPAAPRRGLRKMAAAARPLEAAWRSSLLGRVLTFAAGVAAVLAIAGAFVPHAVVTLYPQSQDQTITIPINAGESIKTASIAGTVPAHALSVTVSAEQSLAVANEIGVPEAKAQGMVRFTNLTQNDVNIPTGTVVSTVGDPSVHYATLHATLLSAGVKQFVDVPIEALDAGASGNAAAETIIVVEGPIGISLSVTNPGLISGGATAKVIGPTDADRSALRQVVLDNLARDAQAQLRAQTSADDVILSDTFEAAQIIDESYTPAAGQPGKTLTLHMQILFTERYVSGADLRQLSREGLDLSIPAGFEAEADPAFRTGAAPTTDTSGATHFDLIATRPLIRVLDRTQIFPLLSGHSLARVSSDLSAALPLRQPPAIVLTPTWWPWMPLLPFNITVAIK